MNKGFITLIAVSLCLVVLAGCGGGSDSAANVVSKPADYSGSWSGVIGGEPFTLVLVGVDATGSVTGRVHSVELSGAFTGSGKTDGTVSGTVNNIIDGNTWDVAFTKGATSVDIESATYGSATLGKGSCESTPSAVANLAGSWVGYMRKTSDDGKWGLLWEGNIQNVRVDLAYAGPTAFVGSIVSDSGLSATMTYTVKDGSWISQFTRVKSWGTIIPVSRDFTSYKMDIAEMDSGFMSDPLAPSSMWGILYVNNYDKVGPDGVTVGAVDYHNLYLVRQNPLAMTCPQGMVWDADKCVAAGVTQQ